MHQRSCRRELPALAAELHPEKSMHVSSRGIEPLPSDCVGNVDLDKESNLEERTPRLPPTDRRSTHTKNVPAIARSRTSRSSSPSSVSDSMVPPRGIEPLPTPEQGAAPDGLAARLALPRGIEPLPTVRQDGCPHRTGSKSFEPPRGIEPQPATFEASRSIRGAVACLGHHVGGVSNHREDSNLNRWS